MHQNCVEILLPAVTSLPLLDYTGGIFVEKLTHSIKKVGKKGIFCGEVSAPCCVTSASGNTTSNAT